MKTHSADNSDLLLFSPTPPVEAITVFYDETCAICRVLHDWIERQDCLVSVTLIPWQNSRAREIFPPLRRLQQSKAKAADVLVLTNTGYFYAGAEAWLACLRSLRRYRPWADRLSNGHTIGFTRRLCTLISKHRHALSWLLFPRRQSRIPK